ncbi:vascular endothelial growth factor receptor 3-like [Sitodiplosis mosellana]|uniref:vascular endothelial growth factor receptor 3-like n=1 Tax=Sitodiplosis mosellana TaxID=263140 RepID=UPI0024449992|nr:vascular endothelial growth factor receptor 3-like [Sitodiplosis mosellana]
MNHVIICVVFFIFLNEVIHSDPQFLNQSSSKLANKIRTIDRNNETLRNGNVNTSREEASIVSNFVDGAVWNVEPSQSFNLTCNFSAEPQPELNWYKYEKDARKAIQITDRNHMSLENDGQTLQFKSAIEDDEGKYECEAKYGQNSHQSRSITIEINVPWYLRKYFFLGLLILIIIILVICQSLRGFSVYNQLERAGLANFVAGDVNNLKPELALDVQADLLPYDQKYEFPRNKLKLGKQLGSGAFGVVLEATAQGIVTHEAETKVAVKMVKKIACNEVMRALVSELKIMVHLGQHLNVVNLLGAVTTDITNFNLMVIVEHCPFGNLQSFLAKNRRYFVDQIVPGTNQINTKIGKIDRNSGCCYRSKACNHTFGGSSLEPILQSASGSGSCLVMMDETTESSPCSITTEDLLIWSFQIARGMDYLVSRKVLHGDLAARNILLCDDNIVKICDFGLARSLCKNENYHMKTKHNLPLKWLALESINNGVFSTYSDIWSFGIVLWELFSLGAKPYSCIKIEDLKYKLNDGYRMEKPAFATECIYYIMLSCWCCNPEKRPKFSELEKIISEMVGNNVSDHYIDLNEPYVEANENRFNSGETDYLALLKSPDSQAPPVPMNVLREKYFPFIAKTSDDTLIATNGIYVDSDVLK